MSSEPGPQPLLASFDALVRIVTASRGVPIQCADHHRTLSHEPYPVTTHGTAICADQARGRVWDS